MTKYFINLTNGIEAIQDYYLTDYNFIRIQSTACEQKRWDFILQELDYTLLMELALGTCCVVYDYGANKEMPRALWQGVEWIRYVLNRMWLDRRIRPLCRGHNTGKYFGEQYNNISDRTKKKLKYFRKFLNTTNIDIVSIGSPTTRDGSYAFYNNLLEERKQKC